MDNYYKPKMAIIFSWNNKEWPLGDMLNFLIDILPYLNQYLSLELFGVRTIKVYEKEEAIKNGELKFSFRPFSCVNFSKKKILPNIVSIVFGITKNARRIFHSENQILYFHGVPLELPFLLFKKKLKGKFIVSHIYGVTYSFKRYFLFSGVKMYHYLRGFVVDSFDLVLLAADSAGLEEFRRLYLVSAFKNFGIHNFIPLQFTPSKCCEEPRKELVISSSNGVIAYAGRLTPKKDPLTVIKAFQKFVILFSDIAARLHIIGDGPLFKGCERLCKGLGLSDRVVLTGVLEREKYLNTLSRQMYTFILQKGMEFLC